MSRGDKHFDRKKREKKYRKATGPAQKRRLHGTAPICWFCGQQHWPDRRHG